MRNAIVFMGVVVSAGIAFIGLPVLFGKPIDVTKIDVYLAAYFLAFVLLVSISLKLISFWLLSFIEKVYLLVVTAAIEFLVWDFLAMGGGTPILAYKKEGDVEALSLGIAAEASSYSPAPVWIALIISGTVMFLYERLSKDLKP